MHPAQIKTRRLWFGPEVEGLLAVRAPYTAFVADVLTAEEMGMVVHPKVRHLFLTETFHDWDWFGETLLPVAPALITVARGGACNADVDARARVVLALPYAARLRLIVRAMPTTWAALLRPLDEVSIGVDYDLLTFQVSDGVRTRPEQYTKDTEAPE